MSKSRGGVIALGVIAVLIAIAVWWQRGSSSPSSDHDDTTEGSGSGRNGRTTRSSTAKLAGKRIAGTVKLDGAPVAGASVYRVTRPGMSGLSAEKRVVSDAEGHFDLGESKLESYAIVAEKPGLTAARVSVDLRDPNLAPPADQLLLAMHTCDAALYGVIRDASGGPIAKARVGASFGGHGMESGDDGTYEVCIPVGDANILVEADGYARVSESISAYGRVRRDFELVPEAIIVGRAIRLDDKSPVAGAEITVRTDVSRGSDGNISWASAISGDDGQFRVDGLIPGDYVVLAKGEHLATKESVNVTAEVGVQQPLTLELAATLVIAGKVIERGGKPVVGAYVAAVSVEGDRSTSNVRSQTDGSFELSNLLPNTYYVFAAGNAQSKQSVVLGTEDKLDVVLEVEPLTSVTGLVTYRGKPVDDCLMRVGGRTVQTDPSGRYLVRGVEPGELEVYAESKRLGAFARDKKLTLAKAEQRTFDVELDLVGAIEGVVVDQTGKPVAGVSLELSLIGGADYGAATTAEDGTFKVGALSGGGNYGYLVRSLDRSLTFPPVEGKRFPPIAVRDGQTRVTGVRIAIRYERQQISGRVQSTKGAPLPDVLVRAEPAKARWTAPSTRTAVDGTFAIRDLPTGTYTMRATSPRGNASLPNITTGSKNVVISVPEPATLTVTLENFTGTVNVWAYANESARLSTQTSTGTAVLRNMMPGDYTINAVTRTGETVTSKITLAEGAAATITLRSRGFASAVVAIVDPDGKPVTDATCHMMFQRDLKPDATGRLRFDKIGVGDTYVGCTTEKLVGGQRFEVKPGGTTEVTMTLKPQREFDEPRGVLGFEMRPQLDEMVVSAVTPDGPAAKAGLMVGDVIVKVNDRDFEDGNGALYGEPGRTIKLTIERDDKERTITLTLGSP